MHKLLAGHECQSAKQRGWGGIKNGDLLRLAEGEYDLFITADQNIRYQQNLTGRISGNGMLWKSDIGGPYSPRERG